MIRRPPRSTLFPYTTLLPIWNTKALTTAASTAPAIPRAARGTVPRRPTIAESASRNSGSRSEEHTSELQSRQYLVCRLLLEKKNKHIHHTSPPTPLSPIFPSY